MDKTVAAVLATPHLEIRSGPHGWTTTIRANNGLVLAYGFTRHDEAPDAKASSVRLALTQLAA